MVFGRRSKSRTCDQSTFYTQLRADPAYQNYLGAVGSGLANGMLGILWEESRSKAGQDGFWSKTNKVINRAPPTTLRFKTEKDHTDLINGCITLLKQDRMLIDVRWNQVTKLRAQANNGELAKQLNAHTKPRHEYQVIHPPRTPAPGAPPIPDKPPEMQALAKGLAWLTHGVHGSTSAYQNAIFKYKKTGFPLGADAQIVTKIWMDLVGNEAGVPKWRKPVMGSMYPSSIGGTHLLRKIFLTSAGTGWPAQGDLKWEDWAMYFFSAIMTIQAFPDGNKRISRTVYLLVMQSGGIPFKAPTDALGAKLANM